MSYATGMALCGAVLTLGACKKNNDANGAADTTMSASSDSAAAAVAATPAPANSAATTPASAPMTDAQIFARLAAANEGEIAAGKMAESKAFDQRRCRRAFRAADGDLPYQDAEGRQCFGQAFEDHS